MSVTLGDKRTAKNRVARYRIGHVRTEGEERLGRPTQVTIPENVDVIHFVILGDKGISAITIAGTAEILGMRKLSAKLVPRCLNADQKRDRILRPPGQGSK
jgi:hypothetical protein